MRLNSAIEGAERCANLPRGAADCKRTNRENQADRSAPSTAAIIACAASAIAEIRRAWPGPLKRAAANGRTPEEAAHLDVEQRAVEVEQQGGEARRHYSV
jgi:hypothetical protein